MMCCASPGGPPESATGGLELSMYVRDETRSEVFYQVTRDGVLHFGGGLDARLESTSWAGALTEPELAQLRQLLEAQDWFQTKPVSTKTPEDCLYRVSLRTPQVSKRFTVKGENTALEPVRELLAQASRRRLDATLERLPQPGPQRLPAPSDSPMPPSTAPSSQPN